MPRKLPDRPPPPASLHALSRCAPPPRETIADWAERCLVLSARTPTSAPGPLRLSRTPYVRGILDALDDPSTRAVAVMAGAQTGKTTAAYAWLMHALAANPSPCLVVYPSEDLARSVSATRLIPLLEDSPALAPLLPRNRRDDLQLLSWRLNGATVALSGANSPAQLASRPIRYLLLDEIDKYPAEATRGEADAVSLAMQRLKTFWDSQALLLSTPTTPAGAIHRHYMAGDRRRYEPLCPRCREHVLLTWQCVRWPDGDPSRARVRCPACGADWTEAERRRAVAAGRWRPTAKPSSPGLVSFHLPSFLSLWSDIPALAARFERAKTDPSALRDFVNSELAEPFVEIDARIRDSDIAARETDYSPAPATPRWDPATTGAITLGGCDVQKGYLVLVLRQFLPDGSSALLWHGMPTRFDEVAALMEAWDAHAICMDARYRPVEVYEAASRYVGIWPAIGVGGFRVPALWEQQERNIDEGRRGRGGRTVQILVADSNRLLDMLADRVGAADGAPSWEIPLGTCASDPDYPAQLTAMYRSNGAWVNPRKLPEHYADAEKLSLLAADVCGIRPQVAPPPPADDEP